MDENVLPLDEHLKLLLNQDFNCDPCEISPEEKFELPPWYNKEKYKRGQKYIQDNIFSQFTNTMVGLLTLLSIPTTLELMISTRKSSCFVGAYKRYLSTIFHVFSWYSDDLNPSTDAWKSLKEVRNRHFKASKTLNLKKKRFITQWDMALTQFGFLGVALLFPEKIGMECDNNEDIEAYLHFWKTVGYMLGIDDKYNLCRPSVEETKIVFESLRKEVFVHRLRYPPEYFYYMTSIIIKSMWYFSPMLNEGGFMYYSMNLMGVEGYDYDWNMNKFSVKYEIDNEIDNNNKIDKVYYEKKLGLYNRFTLHLYHFVHDYVKKSWLAKSYFNKNTYLTIFLLKNFPFLSYYRFGFFGSYIDMFKEDIPFQSNPKTNKEMFEISTY